MGGRSKTGGKKERKESIGSALGPANACVERFVVTEYQMDCTGGSREWLRGSVLANKWCERGGDGE